MPLQKHGESGVDVLKRAFPGLTTVVWETFAESKSPNGPPPMRVTGLQIKATAVIVCEYELGGARHWQVFVPATTSERIDATVLAVAEAVRHIGDPALKLSDHGLVSMG